MRSKNDEVRRVTIEKSQDPPNRIAAVHADLTDPHAQPVNNLRRCRGVLDQTPAHESVVDARELVPAFVLLGDLVLGVDDVKLPACRKDKLQTVSKRRGAAALRSVG
jgi:hypothetical protein